MGDWRLAVRGVVLYRGLQQSSVFIYIRFRPSRAFTPRSCCDISYILSNISKHILAVVWAHQVGFSHNTTGF